MDTDLLFDRKPVPQRPRSRRDPDTKKAQLLALEAGASRPRLEENYSLARALAAYTCKTCPSYDPVFDARIRERHPDWFRQRKPAESLAELLALDVGAPRPRRSDPLGRILGDYTRRTSAVYHRAFDDEIRKRQPGWFMSSADVKKAQMLALPVGAPRPSERPLSTALIRYTCPRNPAYDPVFDTEVRNRHPGWFRKNQR
jgi:hypothetical protein